MNTIPQHLQYRVTLAMLIPDSEWVLPDIATFGDALPGRGDTDRGVPQRLRAHLGLTRTPGQTPYPHGTVIVDRRDDVGYTIARLKVYLPNGDRYLWRRFPLDVAEADITAACREVHAGTIRIVAADEAPAPVPAPVEVSTPALPARPASTSVSRMPTPELRRLRADADDELARRGDLPEPEMAAVETPAPLTDEIAWSHLQARLSAGISPEMLRRIAADSAAAVQRQREAAQAAIEAAQAAMAAAQAELARLG